MQVHRDILDVFMKADKDGSGELNREEFKDALIRLGMGLDEEQLENMVNELDKDGEGITFRFVNELKILTRPSFPFSTICLLLGEIDYREFIRAPVGKLQMTFLKEKSKLSSSVPKFNFRSTFTDDGNAISYITPRSKPAIEKFFAM